MDLLLIPEDMPMSLDPWNFDSGRMVSKRKQWPEDSNASKMRKLNGSQVSPWDQVEELTVDLDGNCSLAGINVDLSSSAFSNSEALLSLPSLSAFKQELLCPFNGSEGNNGDVNGQCSPRNQKQIQQCYNSDEQDHAVPKEFKLDEGSPNPSDDSNNALVLSAPATSTVTPCAEDCRFQYVLAAATSIATKVSEETLTYLNQFQPYEIKLKKLGDLSEYRGKVLKSVVRLCFHERRLQVMEREQMATWEASHPGDSILEVDHPLSYGIFDLSHERLNSVEFLWDPTKEVGVYIKVNCISTEFTPKKHGGEKGVPFRIQVDTYLHGESHARRLHAASCQVKVFKLKGADRKHKQDREKIQKRPITEQEKYQCSYECTVLTDVLVHDDSYPTHTVNSLPASPAMINTDNNMNRFRQVQSVTSSFNTPKEEGSPQHDSPSPPSSPKQKVLELSNGLGQQSETGGVCASWGPQQATHWLQTNRYGPHISNLSSYSGADLLRLSKDNLIQLCGLSDGIRLYNALHAKCILPKTTLYICVDPRDRVYQVLYLNSLTRTELMTKICQILGLEEIQISSAYLQGPNGIKLLLTDQLIAHIPDHSAYSINVVHDGSDRYQLLFKLSENTAPA